QQQARVKFTNAKAKWNECEDSETAECEQVRNNIKVGSKNFLGNSADAIIKHLERIKAKIEGSENLTDEEVEEILAEIDAKIAELEALKEKAEAAETKEEIREAAQEIRDAWKPIRNRAIYWAARLTNAKMGFITGKMVQLENRLEKTVEKMETNGKDVSEIEPLLEEFHSLLVSAKENHEAGVEAWKEFKESGEQAQHAEAKRLMNQARKDAVEAHKVLKQIVREIKEAKGTQEFAETEDEVEEEDEEEE
ncbi:MAG: hypothetical protein L6408_09400, partial [Nanoarchaeota archaeon]|nr:hypothetical protein [Nanoarchaeota archaeon]